MSKRPSARAVDLWIKSTEGEIVCVPEYREAWGKKEIHFAVGDRYNQHTIAAMYIGTYNGARVCFQV